MAKYTIVSPCAFMADGQAVHHTEPGAVVELDPKTARELGHSVKVVAEQVAKVDDKPDGK